MDQILDTIFSFYTIHLVDGKMADMSSMAEFPWHGGTLALAELARQGIVPEDRLFEFIEWTTKVCSTALETNLFQHCLTFDRYDFDLGIVLRYSQRSPLNRD